MNLKRLLKPISTNGNDGKGHYAGVQIVIFGLVKLNFFWNDYFANECAKEHDEACDKIDWVPDPEAALQKYNNATSQFLYCSLAAAGDSADFAQDAHLAYDICKAWGWIRYAAACKGLTF